MSLKQRKDKRLATSEGDFASEVRRHSTEVTDSRSLFLSFLDHLPGYAWIKNPDGSYAYMNKKLVEVLPAQFRSCWRGNTDEDFWLQHAAEYRRNDLIVLHERKEIHTIEGWEHEGRKRSMLVTKFPISDAGGSAIGVGGVSIDVTEHREVEEALGLSEQKYRDVLENLQEGVFQTTPEGKWITASPALARILGFDSPEELINAYTDIARDSYVDPQRREEFKRLLDAKGFVRDFELEASRRDGRKIWLSENVRAVRDEKGDLLRFEGTSQDITDRKRAEATSEAFASLARKLSGARSELDAGKIIAETAQELFGWDACNLDLYDADRDLLHSILNVDTIAGKKIDLTPLASNCPPTPQSRRVIDQGPLLIVREEPVRFDPEAIPFGDKSRPSASIMAVPIRHASAVIGLFSIQSYRLKAYEDATLRSFESLADHCGQALNRIRAEASLFESEERFRQLADNLEDILWIADRDLERVLYINPAYEKITGRSAAALSENLTDFMELVHPDDREIVERGLESQRKGQHPTLEYRMVVNGAVRWLHRRAFPILNDNGEVYRVAGITTDVTERKRAEENLSNLRHELELTMESIREGVHRVDAEKNIVFENPAAAQMLGWEVSDLLGKPGHSTIHHTRADGTPYPEEECPIFATFGDGISRQVSDEVFWRKDGTSFPVEYSTAPMRNEHNEIVAVVVTFRDITERKRAQEVLRESEERYRDLVENSRELICTHALDGLILSANRAAAAALGYDLESFVGKRTIRDILAPEVRHQFDEYMQKLMQDGVTSGLMLVETSSGERRIWEYYNSLRIEGLETPIVRGIARDVTEQRRAERALRESEERYRELFENTNDAIYVHDLRGRYTSVNRAAEKLSGYTRAEILGKHYSNFVDPKHLREPRENFCRKLDVPRETTYETGIICKDGSRKTVEVSSRMIYVDGKPVGVQGTVRDITERKRVQRALETYSRRLIQAQEAERESIARELHDEIGQSLTAISMNLEWIHRSSAATPEAMPRVMETIEVIEDVLQRVRELSLELRPSLLDDLGLSAALRWYAARYSARTGIKAEVTGVLPKSEAPRRALETACFRIAQEALTNTARHSSATMVSVNLAQYDGVLELTVSDDGVGFDVEPLLNGGVSLALGLRGMQERALAVCGQVKIDSKLGKGTQIVLTVPLANKV